MPHTTQVRLGLECLARTLPEKANAGNANTAVVRLPSHRAGILLRRSALAYLFVAPRLPLFWSRRNCLSFRSTSLSSPNVEPLLHLLLSARAFLNLCRAAFFLASRRARRAASIHCDMRVAYACSSHSSSRPFCAHAAPMPIVRCGVGGGMNCDESRFL